MSSSIKRSAFPTVPIQDVARKVPGAIKIGPFGSQLKKEDLSESGYKVYGQENIIAGDFSLGTRRINSSKFFALKSCQLFPGDVVVTMMGTVGRCEIFPADAEVGIMDSHLLRIQVDPDVADAKFIAAMISAKDIVGRQVARFSHGTIMSGLSSAIVRRLLVPLPSPKEQRRIAEILDTVDGAIRQTDAIVAKLQLMKAGLMHDLLTRGLDLQCNLRDPEAHPEQFKDSELGRIPKEWEVVSVSGVGEIVTGSTPPSRALDSWGEFLPFVTPGDIDENGRIRETERCLSVVGAKYVRPIASNSVLTVCIGSTIGKTTLATEACATNQQINALVPYSNYDSRYIYAAVTKHINQLSLMAGLQAVPIVNKTQFGRMLIPVTSLDEQQRISNYLFAFDARIRAEEDNRDKLKAIKQGLMQDLLNGRVRVVAPDKILP